jgi:flagellar basal-body rod protein FlgB
MNILDIPVFSVLRTKMDWLQNRQNVLAANIANANTPRYKAQDLKPVDFAKILAGESGGSGSTMTHAAHISFGSDAKKGVYRSIRSNDVRETPNGNSVGLEDQMMKVAENQMAYQTATHLYRKGVDLIRIAIGSR